MNHCIIPATLDDLPLVCTLFEAAITYQKTTGYPGWNTYDQDFIRTDIQQHLLFKVMHEEHVVGIFSTCYQDPLIWRDLEKGDALYLHRIVLNRAFHGVKLMKEILTWSMHHVTLRKLKYIRMDTWAGNERLIAYYQSYGFRFVEDYITADTPDLPLQHRHLHVALLELEVTQPSH